ncbi:MAG TPA: HD domain-containing phosphohydrolase [Vicinamibacterales bacterium]
MAELDPSAATVLVADDQPENAELLARLLRRDGYTVVVTNDGRDVLDLVARTEPDLILLDVLMPGANGFEICRALKDSPETRLIPVVLITALRDAESRLEGIRAGADDFLSKPFSAPELSARAYSLLRLKRYTDDLDSAESVIISLAMTIEARDPTTQGHCGRLASTSVELGRALQLPPDDLAALQRGGYLHDVGKVGIPDAVLLKTGPLTDDEIAIMRRHTVIGDRLCGELRTLRKVRPIVRSHHERLDGSGYPDGLVGDEVPLLAQIMAIADVFDALTSWRPYREPIPAADACAVLRSEVARGWRGPGLVEPFIALVRAGVVQSERTFAAPELQ